MASWHTEEVLLFVCTLAVGPQPYGWTIRVVRIERFKYGSVRAKGEVAVTIGRFKDLSCLFCLFQAVILTRVLKFALDDFGRSPLVSNPQATKAQFDANTCESSLSGVKIV
jgi:hypothetical protein